MSSIKRLYPTMLAMFTTIFLFSNVYCKSKSVSQKSSSQPGSISKSKQKSISEIQNNESKAIFLYEIRFQVRAKEENFDIYEDGIRATVKLKNPEPDIANMKNPQEIVIPFIKAILY